jgi:4-carboxymuconolactone decarboxylase
MARLGPLDHESLSEAQRSVADSIRSGPRAGLAGPFWPWLRSPELADRAQRLGEFVRFKTSLPQRLVELAVLYTAQAWKAQFEWHIHAPIGRKEGLADTVVDALQRGADPVFSRDDERIVYRLCDELYRTRRISDGTYAESCRLLTETGVVELIGVLGYYALVSMTLNAFSIDLPAGAALPFPEP